MPIPILETCRKRKRKPKVYGLQRFGEDGIPISRVGDFRDNIRVFLRESAEVEEYNIRGSPVWCTLLSHETKNSVIPLYTVEEDVIHSDEPYCDQCRCTGWSNHLVSKRKYHLIIPIDSEWNMPLEDDAFDLQTHLLHGLIHTNGFGHLICINGMEGGSKYLCGREIVDLWDRICTIFGARMITVEDMSKKRSMDLRLLYGVAYGHSWFGRWGYKFCRGSYGVTKTDYENAIKLLGSIELDQIEFDFSEHKQYKEIKQIFRYYREMSEGNLNTFKDLLRFMLIIKSHSPQKSKLLPVAAPSPLSTYFPQQKRSNRLSSKKSDVIAEKDKSLRYKDYSVVAANLGSRWPVRRLEFAAQVIVDSLKEMKALNQNGMTRQDVRDAARLQIGDTGLLDYVLKSMNNVVLGNVLVRRYVDPVTRILHYTIDDLDDATKQIEQKKEVVLEPKPLRILAESKPGADVHKDLLLLYTNVLFDYPESELVKSATQVILDSKHFVKEWPLWDNNEKSLRFVCLINQSLIDLRSEQITERPPGEIVTVSLQATVFDLKRAIEETFRDTYCILTNFVVDEIDELMDDDDRKLVFGRIESGSALTVRGFGIDSESKLKCQGGCDTWMVRCVCKARDDDGERMVACDVCEVWQHTRCCGIDDADTLPPLFVCSNCSDDFAEQQRKVLQPKYEFPNQDNMLLIGSTDDYFGEDSCLGMNFPSENFFCDQFIL